MHISSISLLLIGSKSWLILLNQPALTILTLKDVVNKLYYYSFKIFHQRGCAAGNRPLTGMGIMQSLLE